ncbi:MAG: inositol transport system permease protein [Clostridiales bacterium]|nr:inositol transport system permease protein [Clostridiales bacterium]
MPNSQKSSSNALKKKTIDSQSFQMFFVLIGMCVIMTILYPPFIRMANLINVIRQISITAIIGMGVTMCIITTGIDLSSGSVVALAGVVAASFGKGDYPLILPIILALIAGAACGFINGSLSAYGKIPPFIATLGMMSIARGAALIYSDGRPITGLSDAFNFIGGGYILGIPMPVIIMIIVGIIMYVLLNHTKFGKYVYAIGGNQRAAVASGINVKKYLVIIYTLASVLAALAGIILAARLNAGQPTAGVSYELDAIASSVIGGTSLTGGIGTIPGVIIGALIIGVLTNGLVLLGVSPYIQTILKGVIIIAAVLIDALRRNRG